MNILLSDHFVFIAERIDSRLHRRHWPVRFRPDSLTLSLVVDTRRRARRPGSQDSSQALTGAGFESKAQFDLSTKKWKRPKYSSHSSPSCEELANRAVEFIQDWQATTTLIQGGTVIES